MIRAASPRIAQPFGDGLLSVTNSAADDACGHHHDADSELHDAIVHCGGNRVRGSEFGELNRKRNSMTQEVIANGQLTWGLLSHFHQSFARFTADELRRLACLLLWVI